MLSKGNTSGAGSTSLNPLAQQLLTRAGTFIAIVLGVIVFAKLMDIPMWIAIPVVLGIWASYFKKSKSKE
jgi:DMSO/TMAO reductase YedYZ heme-binding membrane subunit